MLILTAAEKWTVSGTIHKLQDSGYVIKSGKKQKNTNCEGILDPPPQIVGNIQVWGMSMNMEQYKQSNVKLQNWKDNIDSYLPLSVTGLIYVM